MPKATHLDHPNWLLLLHHVGLRLIVWVHDQTIEIIMRIMQEKTIKWTYTP
jgi:hypothetical protein